MGGQEGERAILQTCKEALVIHIESGVQQVLVLFTRGQDILSRARHLGKSEVVLTIETFVGIDF